MTVSDAPGTGAGIRERVDTARRDVEPVWEVVRLTLPSGIIPLLAGAVLCGVPQGLETLRVIAQGGNVPRDTLSAIPIFSLYVTVAVAGLTAWYCARVALYIYQPSTQLSPTGAAKLIPRLWGLIPPLSVAAGYAVIVWTATERDVTPYVVLLVGAIGLSVALYFFFAVRRWVITSYRASRSQTVSTPQHRTDAAASLQPSLSDLPKTSRIIFALIAAVWVLLCLWIIWMSGAYLWWLTTPGIVMLSAASWITAITWLLYESRHRKKAFGWWLIGAAVAFSFFNWNEDHRVRRIDTSEQVSRPLPASQAIAEWMAGRPDRSRYGHAYPVFIVAAEGGGIRAAMIASLVMGYLTDVCPAFPIHTLAISGVSGGSVGSAAYVALARRHGIVDSGAPCPQRTDSYPLVNQLGTFVSQDYLTPELAEGLYPDVLAWFWPFPWSHVDRARALELAFSRGIEESIDGGNSNSGMLFERSFLGYASDTSLGWRTNGSLPALMLNTTRVETGQRVLVSQIKLSDTGAAGVLTTSDIDPSLDVPLSTAASLSARFPVISPEGVIKPRSLVDSESKIFRLVDGGYYDNSGLATALTLAALVRENPDAVPVVIRVGYEVAPARSGAVQWGGRSSFEPWAGALSPILSLLNARDAHTAGQIASLERLRQATAVGDTTGAACSPTCMQRRRHPIHAAEFLLLKDSVPYVLGWLMSRRAVEAAKITLKPPVSCETRTPPAAVPHSRALGVQPDTLKDKEYCAIFGMLNGSPAATVRRGLR